MVIEIPDEILHASPALKPEDFKLEFAIWLYERRLFTLAKSAQWVGLTRLQFQKALAARGIPMHYTAADLAMDVQNM